MNQGYYAYVDENDKVKKGNANYYKNLKLLPKSQASLNTLTQ